MKTRWILYTLIENISAVKWLGDITGHPKKVAFFVFSRWWESFLLHGLHQPMFVEASLLCHIGNLATLWWANRESQSSKRIRDYNTGNSNGTSFKNWRNQTGLCYRFPFLVFQFGSSFILSPVSSTIFFADYWQHCADWRIDCKNRLNLTGQNLLFILLILAKCIKSWCRPGGSSDLLRTPSRAITNILPWSCLAFSPFASVNFQFGTQKFFNQKKT